MGELRNAADAIEAKVMEKLLAEEGHLKIVNFDNPNRTSKLKPGMMGLEKRLSDIRKLLKNQPSKYLGNWNGSSQQPNKLSFQPKSANDPPNTSFSAPAPTLSTSKKRNIVEEEDDYEVNPISSSQPLTEEQVRVTSLYIYIYIYIYIYYAYININNNNNRKNR